MSGHENSLVEKLDKLVNTQQSIQGMSLSSTTSRIIFFWAEILIFHIFSLLRFGFGSSSSLLTQPYRCSRQQQTTHHSTTALSLWIMYHKRRAELSVDIWRREILASQPKRKLVYLYLANEVLQNAKKETPVFEEEFSKVIINVVSDIFPYVIPIVVVLSSLYHLITSL